ncbi:MAG: hypothetical protein M1834_002920 [Cirrosporium novae-zelandiae]|nr:MAG: hypothetical protein M1834_002920 [Cirrosporium novae-zelandiae]
MSQPSDEIKTDGKSPSPQGHHCPSSSKGLETQPPLNASSIRDLNRSLNSILRDDWIYPPPTVPSSATTPYLLTTLQPNSVTWLPRTYSDSSGSSTDEFEMPIRSKKTKRTPEEREQRRLARRRRRSLREREEEEWNEGLRCWRERRDAWSGVSFGREQRKKGNEDGQAETVDISENHKAPPTISDPLPTETTENPSDTDLTPSEASSPSIVVIPSPSMSDSDESLIPTSLPPLISPSLPVRASIQPSSYSAIYTKIVMAGSTPTIPINLSDMTKALVEGWKGEGNWPPKSTVPTTSSVGGNAGGGLSGVGAWEAKAVVKEVKKYNGVRGKVKRLIGLERGEKSGKTG